jgi:hypothetical protein
MNVSAQRPPVSTRILAFVLEGLKLFGIAVGCLIIFALILFISVKAGIVLAWRWIALSYWTSFLIWLICKLNEANLKQVRFWVTLFCLLLIHVTAFVVVLKRYPEWRLIWYVPIVVIEEPCMGMVLQVVMRNKQQPSSRYHPPSH